MGELILGERVPWGAFEFVAMVFETGQGALTSCFLWV